MIRRDLQLMIMESAGGPVRRVRFPMRRVIFGIGVAALALSLSVAVAIHSLLLRQTAQESVRIAEENRVLRAVLDEVEGGVPEIEREALRSDMAFSQVWAKSGLGVEPSMLAVGPVEGDDNQTLKGIASSPVNRVDPLALGLELDRIADDSNATREMLSALVDYFNDAAQMLSNTPSIRPTDSPWLTSGFGKRADPIDGRLMMHKGLDIGGSVGSHIVAPADGVVIFAGTRGGYGKTLVVDHGYGYQTHFAHLSGFAANVGDRINRGQLIAYMGSTGKSTGPHLHYEVRRFGRPLDPIKFILD